MIHFLRVCDLFSVNSFFVLRECFFFFRSQCRKHEKQLKIVLQNHQIKNMENKFKNTGNNCQTCFLVSFIFKNKKQFSETETKQALNLKKNSNGVFNISSSFLWLVRKLRKMRAKKLMNHFFI